MIENLLAGLRLSRTARLAIVGAGGKTSALLRLARGFAPPVLLAASAHMGAWQLGLADEHHMITTLEELDPFEAHLPPKVLLFTGPLRPDQQRTHGLEAHLLERLRQLGAAHQAPLLIEADGARRLALKAPAAHEPPIPGFVEQVLVVAGLSAVGKALNEENVYGAERFAALSGLQMGKTIDPPAIARVLAHPEGGLKNIPPGARRLALFNQADTPELQAGAAETAASLLEAFEAVGVAALHSADPGGPAVQLFSIHEPLSIIILAAGAASRMGAPKLLLPWRGQPVIRHVADTALACGASEVMVVTGAHAQEIRQALEGLPLHFAHNPDWEAGQSSSVAAAVRQLSRRAGSALFLLGDQPHIPAALVRALIQHHAQNLAAITAPAVRGQRANPVLFDRGTFAELATLSGDSGGRQLFARYAERLARLPWDDERLLFDLDTPEDYQRLVEWET